MKKLLTLTLTLIMVLSLTACGEKQSSTPDDKDTSKSSSSDKSEFHGDTEGAADLSNVSNSNYKEVTKNVFGISTKDASGWTINKAESANGVNNLEITYDVTSGEDAKAVLEYYYDQCKSVSSDGIYEVVTDYEKYTTSKGAKYDTFESYFATATKINTLYQTKWIYDNNGKNIQFLISIDETYAKLSFSLLG